MPVAPEQGFKATEIQLLSFARPHMRGFHFAWASFFCAFVCWFAFAPLMFFVKQDLDLNLSQVFTTNILSVAGTVMCRFAIGPLCDKIGPKICQFSLLSWIVVFTLLGAAAARDVPLPTDRPFPCTVRGDADSPRTGCGAAVAATRIVRGRAAKVGPWQPEAGPSNVAENFDIVAEWLRRWT